MNNRCLIGSVVLNGVLAVSLILILTKKPIPIDHQSSPPLVSPSTQALATRPPSSTPPATTPRVVSLPFHWSQVESEDYQEYIANLREIGCPEETIRDIIIADVNNLFEPRYVALSRSAPELAWWGRFDARKPLRADLAMQLDARNEEKKAILTRLLGPSAGADFAFTETHVTDLREAGLFPFLPESKRGTVRDLVKRYQAMRERNEFKWKTRLPLANRRPR